jgi:hypothetical protein
MKESLYKLKGIDIRELKMENLTELIEPRFFEESMTKEFN